MSSSATSATPAGATGGLRRAIGLRTVVSTSTGLAFAALEYLAAAGLVTYVAGDSAWIAVAVAGVLALLAWGFFGELNGMFPTAAAIRLYMKRSMDDRVALTITFTYMTTIVLVIAADAFIVGSAIAHVLSQASWVAGIWIVLLIGAAVFSNLRGVRVAGNVQDVATYSVLVLSAAIALTALVRSHRALSFPLSPLHHHGPGDLIEAIALGIFLYSAFEWVTTSAEEVRRAEQVPRGMLIALGLLFVACALMCVSMSHVLTRHQLSLAYPQLLLGRAAIGRAGLWLMAGVTALTALNTFNGGFITASRFIYATAREGSLPLSMARLNDRAVPWVPVVALGTVSLVVSLVVAATGSWQVLVAVGAALEAMIYAVAGYCVARLRRRLPDQPRPFRILGKDALAGRLVAAAGTVLFGVLAVVASVSVGNRFDPVPLAVIAVCAALSAYYVLRVMPKVRAAHEASRARGGRRRPAAGPVPGPGPAPARGPGSRGRGSRKDPRLLPGRTGQRR